MRKFNPEMMKLAREASGLTQKGLAEQAKISQSKISKIEEGLLPISHEDVQVLAELLKQPVEFFYRPERATSSAVSFYRKTTTLPIGVFRQRNAQMNIRRIELQGRIRDLGLGTQQMPYIPIDEGSTPSAAARELRKKWKLPPGPIGNLTKLAEAAGCVIVHFDFDTKKLDGLCLWSEGDVPFIFLNRQFPAARMRLTLAHELGHLVMHRAPNENVEIEAWEFAAELLMPAAVIREELYPLSLAHLAKLKLRWGVSMQALIQRAKGLEAISERYCRYLWMQMGKSGYRTQEPYDDTIPKEKPEILAN